MLLKIESARSAAYYAGWAAAAGEPELAVLASLAKAYCSEAYFHCAAESMQIHGGVGYFKPSVVERIYRDQRVTEIYEGTSEIQRLVISRALIGEL